jgi:hypothetical protein
MYIDYVAVLVATIVQFIIGAIWYMPLFGGLWGRIHGFDTHSPEAQAEMRKGMLPLLVVQFVTTLVTTFVYALLLNAFPTEWNEYGLVAFLWLGFVVPVQIGAVIFGGTPGQWVIKKILVMAFGSLVCLEAMAFVISVMS